MTVLEMGHVNATMLFGNYRELVKPEGAALGAGQEVPSGRDD